MSLDLKKQSDNPNRRDLAEVLFALYAPGTTAYAMLVGRDYFPAKDNAGVTLKLSPEVVEHHLTGKQPIGVYPVGSGSDVCHFAVLDFDDHDGTLGWDTVRSKASEVSKTLKDQGFTFLALRSGGGKGVHLFLPFDGPVKAAAVRRTLREVLSRHGLTDGSEGVANNQVEIFPKQDAVKAGKLGNLIALPLARKSVLLDDRFEEVSSEQVVQTLQALPRNSASLILDAPVPEELPASPHADVNTDMKEPGNHALVQCEFVQHCIKDAETLPEPLWLAAATNAAQAAQGRAFFHYISKHDGQRYDAAGTDAKFDHAQTLQAYSCRKLGEIGYICPKMRSDGTCSITGGTNPASFVIPVSRVIESLRAQKSTPQVRNRRIATTVKTRLIESGSFFVSTPDKELLYFERSEKQLYRLQSDAFAAYLSDKYGLNRAEQEFNFVQADIEAHALRYGVAKRVHRVAYFSGEALYVDAGAQQMYRLDGKSIVGLSNGDDGVLFRDSDRIEPFTFDPDTKAGYVRRYLTDQLHTSDVDLKDLLEVYIHALFFERLLPTKPIVLVTGEKGSGKSFVGRAIKRTLIGGNADVDIGLTADEGSARAAVTHNYFIVMDNVDGMVDWLGNLLASVSTGAVIRMRTLYKTNEESQFEPHCFVMVNSRNPASLQRDDIADRLLIFEVTRRKEFVPEGQLLGDLGKNRQAIRSELLMNLNRIVAALKSEQPAPPSTQRLADFAALTSTIAKVLNLPGAERAIAGMDERRNDLVLEGDPLVGALLGYTLDQTTPEWITTGALFAKLKENGDFGKLSARGFGKKLKNLQSNLREHLEIEWRDGAHNTKEVKLTPTPAARKALEERFGLQAKQPEQGKEVKEVKSSSKVSR